MVWGVEVLFATGDKAAPLGRLRTCNFVRLATCCLHCACASIVAVATLRAVSLCRLKCFRRLSSRCRSIVIAGRFEESCVECSCKHLCECRFCWPCRTIGSFWQALKLLKTVELVLTPQSALIWKHEVNVSKLEFVAGDTFSML